MWNDEWVFVMSTKGSLYYKSYEKAEVDQLNYVELHIFEETLTAPPYRIDVEIQINDMCLRGVLNFDSIKELKHHGIIPKDRMEFHQENLRDRV